MPPASRRPPVLHALPGGCCAARCASAARGRADPPIQRQKTAAEYWRPAPASSTRRARAPVRRRVRRGRSSAENIPNEGRHNKTGGRSNAGKRARISRRPGYTCASVSLQPYAPSFPGLRGDMPAAQSAVQKQANVRFHLHPRHRSAGQSGGPNFIIIHYFAHDASLIPFQRGDAYPFSHLYQHTEGVKCRNLPPGCRTPPAAHACLRAAARALCAPHPPPSGPNDTAPQCSAGRAMCSGHPPYMPSPASGCPGTRNAHGSDVCAP